MNTNDWKPIESAPKYGVILLFSNDDESKFDVGKWHFGEWTTVFGEIEKMTKWKVAGI